MTQLPRRTGDATATFQRPSTGSERRLAGGEKELLDVASGRATYNARTFATRPMDDAARRRPGSNWNGRRSWAIARQEEESLE
jgi:hypothetical protein